MKGFVVLAFALLAQSGPAAADSAPVVALIGPARVVDGDTLALESVRIRLKAIDAPEVGEPCAGAPRGSCADVATAALAALLRQVGPIRCEVVAGDRYGRPVAICRDARGEQDLGAILVNRGLARVLPAYDDGHYAVFERNAQARREGFWNCHAPTPPSWRADKAALCR